jgi:hypothetical protein
MTRASRPAARDIIGAGRGGTSSVTRMWRLAMGLSVLIATCDALLGRSVVLLALLSLSPCCALLTGRWTRTALAGVWAIALGVPLGLADGIWGTGEDLAMLGIVLVASVLSTAAAVILQGRAPGWR